MRLVDAIAHEIDVDEVSVEPTEPEGGIVYFKKLTDDGFHLQYTGSAQYTILVKGEIDVWERTVTMQALIDGPALDKIKAAIRAKVGEARAEYTTPRPSAERYLVHYHSPDCDASFDPDENFIEDAHRTATAVVVAISPQEALRKALKGWGFTEMPGPSAFVIERIAHSVKVVPFAETEASEKL